FVGYTDHVRDGATGGLGDGPLHFCGSHIGACGLDHRAAPADEVVEAVRVGADEIAGVEPSVGVEGFFAAAPIVLLHDVRSAHAELADVAGCDGLAAIGIDDLGVEAGRRLAERSASMFRLVGDVTTEQVDATRLRHAEHVVPQLRIGRTRIRCHDRVKIAAAHRREVALGQAGMTGQLYDAGYETVGHGGLFGLQ